VSAATSYVAPEDALALAVPKPPRRRSYPRYPCLTLEETSAKREQWNLNFYRRRSSWSNQSYTDGFRILRRRRRHRQTERP